MPLNRWIGLARILTTAGTLFTISGTSSADPVTDFYRGKTISLILSTGTGGGYNEYAQSFARYFGEHLPGKPSVIVQHMPGAGGIRATTAEKADPR